jgi:hypothetical protein
MAGSFSHIINENGDFTMDYIENLGDATEALEECFYLIKELSGRDIHRINTCCCKLEFPTVPVLNFAMGKFFKEE